MTATDLSLMLDLKSPWKITDVKKSAREMGRSLLAVRRRRWGAFRLAMAHPVLTNPLPRDLFRLSIVRDFSFKTSSRCGNLRGAGASFLHLSSGYDDVGSTSLLQRRGNQIRGQSIERGTQDSGCGSYSQGAKEISRSYGGGAGSDQVGGATPFRWGGGIGNKAVGNAASLRG